MLTRRGLFRALSGLTAALTLKPATAAPVKSGTLKRVIEMEFPNRETKELHAAMQEHFSEETYQSWLRAIDVETFDGATLKLSFPVRFLRRWVESHYAGELEVCARKAFPTLYKVQYVLRQPGSRYMKAA